MKNITCAIPSKADGLLLQIIITEADNPKGIVQFSHGMAENKERYLPIMEFLCKNGFICIINDHRGHGGSVRSMNDLGYFYDGGGAALVNDLLTVNHFVKNKYPGLPVFLFGHSMGSLAVRAFAKEHDDEISGMFVCGSPSFNPAVDAAAALCKIEGAVYGEHHRARLINKLAFGAFDAKFHESDEPYRWISLNSDNVIAYQNSPYCGFCFTVNGFKSLFWLMKKAYSVNGWSKKNAGMPVHFLSGEEDPCLVSERSFNRAVNHMRERGYNVTSKLYSGLRHEILNEKSNYNIFNDILKILNEWVNK